jgi:hypothetical protein
MIPKDQLYSLYVVQGFNTTEIAQKCGVSNVSICNWLRRYGIPARPRKKLAEPIDARFSASYRIAENGCWIWTKGYAGGRAGRYGMLRLPDGSAITGHRLSYQIHKGAIPPGTFVCHTCDNPGCVNPDHLWLGTNSDNQKDAVAKGRHSNNLPSSNKRAEMNLR